MEKLTVDPLTQAAEDYFRLNKDIGKMIKEGLQPSETILLRRMELDKWLTDNTDFWKSNFGYERGKDVRQMG